MRRLWLIAVILMVAGCAVRLDTPKGVIDCSGDGACPTGYVCLDSGTCVTSGTVCVSGHSATNEGATCATGSTHGICRSGACIDCGNGTVELGEACDDGNSDDTDGCPSTCLTARCGDGFVHAGVEQCDDGNSDDTDGCLSSCTRAACGDGFVDAALGEQCDDGNDNPNDGCNQCRTVTWQSQISFGLGPQHGAPLLVSYADLSAVAEGANGIVYTGWAANNPLAVQGVTAGDPAVSSSTGGVYAISTAANITIQLTKRNTGLIGDELDETSPARTVLLGAVAGLAPDQLGNVYLAVNNFVAMQSGVVDPYSGFVLQIDAKGILRIIAGGDAQCIPAPGEACGDGGRARDARFDFLTGIVRDQRGVVFVADGARVRMIDTSLNIDSVPQAFTGPLFIAIDAADRLIVADSGAHTVYAIDDSGNSTVLAGGTCAGLGSCNGTFVGPVGVAADSLGNVYVADSDGDGGDIIELVGNGTTTTVYGTTSACVVQPCGDGGPATQATTGSIRNMTAMVDDTLLVVETIDAKDLQTAGTATRIRAVDPRANHVSAFAGAAGAASPELGNFGTSHGAGAGSVAVEDSGDVLFASFAQVLRWSATTHIVSLVAGELPACGGSLTVGRCGQPSGAAQSFRFSSIRDIDEASGVIYVGDTDALRVFAIQGGTVTTVFGSGTRCGLPVCADNADPTQVSVKAISGIGVRNGHLYVSDGASSTVWDVTLPNGPATRIAGTGAKGKPSGGAATASALSCPLDVTATADGTVYVADTDNCAIWSIDPGADTIANAYQGSCPATIGNGCGGWTTQPGAFNPDFLPLTIDALGNEVVVGTDQDVSRLQAGVRTLILGKDACTALPNAALLESMPATDECVLTPAVATNGSDRILVSHVFNSSERAIRDISDGTFHTLVGDIEAMVTGPFSVATLGVAELARFGPSTFLATDAAGYLDRADIGTGILDTVGFARDGTPLGQTPVAARFVAPAKFDKGAAALAIDHLTSRVFVASQRGVSLAVIDARDPSSANWMMAELPSSVLANGASLVRARALAFDEVHGVLYASDGAANGVYALDLSGGPRVVAGTPPFVGNAGDGGPATSALLDAPSTMAVSAAGTLYIADTGNNKVRRVRNDGIIETVLGTGIASNDDQVGMASALSVEAPRALAFDQFGNLVVTAGPTVHVVYATGLDEAGEPSGASQSSTIYDATKVVGDRDYINCLAGAFSNSDGVMYVVDECAGVVMALSQVPAN